MVQATQKFPQVGGSKESGQEFAAQKRAAIDVIATVRTRLVRCAYSGQVTARPDPASAKDKSRMGARVEALSSQLVELDRVLKILKGTDPTGEFSKTICEWIADVAGPQHPVQIRLQQIIPSLQRLYEKAADHLTLDTAADDSTILDQAIKEFIEVTGDCHLHVTDLCDALWVRLDTDQMASFEGAIKARIAIDDTLAKLEKIGKHVRLVSLNASVEASRAGDAGKGLAVIAVEFKALAEEIQNLSADARAQIENMS